MDEKKLAELLKEAAADTPPPTFTQDDVTRESARQRVRRRNGLLAGSAFGVALLAGATALSVALWTGPGPVSEALSTNDSASAGNGNAAPNELPNEENGQAAPTERGGESGLPPEMPKQGGYPDGNGGPAGPTGTPSGCEQVDRGLAAALAGELPDTADITAENAVPSPLACSAEVRGGAMFNLPDGQLTVLLVPPGELTAFESQSPGARQADAVTSDGGSVVVLSVPSTDSGSPPYESDLANLAGKIAEQY